MDVNKSHGDNKGGGEGKSKASLTSVKVTLHIPSAIMSRK
jgi:hypothetical protein